MKSLDNEEKLMTFRSVENMLVGKNVPVNDNLIRYVRDASYFFNGVLTDLCSIENRGEIYSFSEKDLKKILGHLDYEVEWSMDYPSRQRKEIERAIKDFRSYLTRFQELEEEPKRFFSDESRIKDAYGISSKMKNFYQRLVDEEDFHELTTPED